MTNDDDLSDIDDAMDDFDQDGADLGSGPVLSDGRGKKSSLMKYVLPAVTLIAVAGAGGFYLLNTKQPSSGYVAQSLESQGAVPQAPESSPQPPQPVAVASEMPAPPAQDLSQPSDALGKLEDEVLSSNEVPRGPEGSSNVASASIDSSSTEPQAVIATPVPVASGPVVSGLETSPSQPQVLGPTPSVAEQPVVIAPVVETTVAPPPMPSPSEIPSPVSSPVVAPSVDVAQDQGVGPIVSADSVSEAIVGDSSTAVDQTPAAEAGSDTYYDSRLNVPTGPMADAVGPRKVDPVQEPASKFVIADKTYDGSDLESQLVAANRALDLGRYESAMEMFENLYKRNDRDPRILMGRAISQQKSGRDDQAIVSYEALLDIAPDNTNAVINLMGLIQKQYPSVAQRRLLDLQAKYPGNPGIAAQLGMTFAQMGDNNEALRFLGMAASIDPKNASHLYNMAVITDRMGNTARAVGYYQQALETDAVYGGGRSIPRATIYDRLAALRVR